MAKENIPDVVSIAAQLETEYSSRNADIEYFRQLRDLEVVPDVPAGMESELVVSSTAPQIIERTVGMLTTDPMRLEVPPAGPSDAQMRQSSKMERWTKTALDELERQSDEDNRERFTESLVVDGAGVMRMLYAPGMWNGMPKRKDFDGTDTEYNKAIDEWKVGQRLPIVWTWVDPLCVFPIWSEAGLECVLEKDERNLITLDPKKFNKYKETKPELWELNRYKGTQGKVEFIQYWTRDTITYAVGGEIVHHAKHQYKRPPYCYTFGQTVSTKDSQKRGRSILYPLRYLIPYQDRLLSQRATAIRIWCWPTPVFKQSPLNMAAVDAQTGKPTPLRKIEVQPGKTVSLYADEDISFLVWQGEGPDADKMINIVSTMIERAGLSDSMFGMASGDTSGYTINQLIAAARVKYKPIIKHAERAIEDQIRTLWDIIEYQIKSPVSLHVGTSRRGEWLSLGPDDLKGYRQVKVTLNPIIPTDSYAISSKAINEMQAGLRSRTSAMQEIGVEQPDEMMNQMLVEQYKQRPEVVEFITAEALKRAQFQLDQMKEQQQSAAVDEFMQLWPTLPPAAQQAIMMQQIQTAPGGQTQGMPQAGMQPTGAEMGVAPTVGNSGAQVMAGPGSNYASPAPPVTGAQASEAAQAQANAPQTQGAPVRKLGKRVSPTGMASGQPTGPHKRGSE